MIIKKDTIELAKDNRFEIKKMLFLYYFRYSFQHPSFLLHDLSQLRQQKWV